jgi:hypothetical protein
MHCTRTSSPENPAAQKSLMAGTLTHSPNRAALFEKIFVEKLKWMSAPLYMELFALGQCLPGPTSTQVQSGNILHVL